MYNHRQPGLGKIPPTALSGGVKTLILVGMNPAGFLLWSLAGFLFAEIE